jgi:hypothetical protein
VNVSIDYKKVDSDWSLFMSEAWKMRVSANLQCVSPRIFFFFIFYKRYKPGGQGLDS